MPEGWIGPGGSGMVVPDPNPCPRSEQCYIGHLDFTEKLRVSAIVGADLSSPIGYSPKIVSLKLWV